MSNIQFSTKGLGSSQNSLYEVEKFNGADYTTTPTAVDETRAIDVSNYLPEGNGLVKRNGGTDVVHIDTHVSGNVAYETIENTYKPLKVYKNREGKTFVFCSDNYLGTEHLQIIYYTDLEDTNNYGENFGLKIVPSYVFLYNGSSQVSVSNLPRLSNIKFIKVFEIKDRIYFFTGEGYYYITEVLVNSSPVYRYYSLSEPYIPLTVTNIPALNKTGKALSLEQPNMLTSKVRLSLNFSSDVTHILNSTVYETAYEDYKIQDYLPNETFPSTIYSNASGYVEVEVVDENGNKFVGRFYRSATLSSTLNVLRVKYTVYSDSSNEKDIATVTFLTNHSNCKINDSFEITVDGTETFNSATNVILNCDNAIFYDDKLFVSKGNVMYHTLTPNFPKNIDDFSYFGTDTYQIFGDSLTSIVATGILNNGYMLVIKESEHDKTNIYLRHKEYRSTIVDYSIGDIEYQYNKTEELYPITQAGIDLYCDNNVKTIQYDNKVIISTKKGIYYVNVEASTASQTYNAYELSYMIRNDLSDDLSVNSMTVCDGLLYVARKNKDGNIRVYVADKDRYTFVDGKMQYEWWAIDKLNVDEFLYEKDYLLYRDAYEKKLMAYAYNKLFSDVYTFPLTKNGSFEFVTKGERKSMICKMYAYNQNTTIANYSGRYAIPTGYSNPTTYEDLPDGYKEIKYYDVDYLTVSLPNWVKERFEKDDYLDFKKHTKIHLQGRYAPTSNLTLALTYQLLTFSIKNLYYIKFGDGNTEIARYKIEDCELVDNKWYYTANNHFDLLGDKGTVVFCYLELNDEEIPIRYIPYEYNYTMYVRADPTNLSPSAPRVGYDISEDYGSNSVLLESTDQTETIAFVSNMEINFGSMLYYVFQRPIKTYWKSKFTDLGATEVLKSTNEVYFVPETRRGGAVSIGYKTAKREKDFSQRKIILARISEEERNQIELGRYSFDDVDFTDFHFETDTFAHIYSCRRKVKNFAFIQFKFYSDEPKDSTIVKFAVKYHKTRDSRGAR